MLSTENVTASATFQTAERQTRPVRRFIDKFLNDWSLDFASMLAYNVLISLLPIAIVIFGIFGLVLKDNPQGTQDLKDKIVNIFPSDNTTRNGIIQVVDLAFDQLSKNAGAIFAIGFVLAIFSSSRLFVAIDRCMTIIYRLPERSFLRQNLMALGMLGLFLLIIAVMFAAGSFPSALMNLVQGGGGQFGVFVAGILLSTAIAFGLFEFIYYVTPNKKMTFKETWCGALVAAITLELFIILFPLYVRQFMSNYAGQIGFAVILILFFYYFAIILIFGAQINAHFFSKHPPFHKPLGTYLSEMYQEHRDGPVEEAGAQNDHQSSISKSMKKYWPFRKRSSTVEPLSEERDGV